MWRNNRSLRFLSKSISQASWYSDVQTPLPLSNIHRAPPHSEALYSLWAFLFTLAISDLTYIPKKQPYIFFQSRHILITPFNCSLNDRFIVVVCIIPALIHSGHIPSAIHQKHHLHLFIRPHLYSLSAAALSAWFNSNLTLSSSDIYLHWHLLSLPDPGFCHHLPKSSILEPFLINSAFLTCRLWSLKKSLIRLKVLLHELRSSSPVSNPLEHASGAAPLNAALQTTGSTHLPLGLFSFAPLDTKFKSNSACIGRINLSNATCVLRTACSSFARI